jgi:hypothetical protein
MPINQREVYILPHPWDNDAEKHPFIVLSCLDANNHERTFLAVMITSEPKRIDDFSFLLQDGMFERPLKYPNCHARMHLIMMALNEDTEDLPPVNKMKKGYFDQLMKSIGDLIFNFDFSPL